MKRIFAAGVLGLVLAGSALAQSQSGSQSNISGPGGGGAGIGGMIGGFLPSANGLAPGSGINVGNRMAAARGNSTSAIANRAVGNVLIGTPGAAANLVQALIQGGVPSVQSNLLAQALATFGSTHTLANLVLMIEAYNNAIRAMPAGGKLSPEMRTIRHAALRFGSRTGPPSP